MKMLPPTEAKPFNVALCSRRTVLFSAIEMLEKNMQEKIFERDIMEARRKKVFRFKRRNPPLVGCSSSGFCCRKKATGIKTPVEIQKCNRSKGLHRDQIVGQSVRKRNTGTVETRYQRRKGFGRCFLPKEPVRPILMLCKRAETPHQETPQPRKKSSTEVDTDALRGIPE